MRVIVLTGAGEKAFVAGADIKEFADFDQAQGEDLARRGQRDLFDRVEQSRKPVVAAVNGFALGGGLELAMAAHVRIASSNARMGLPEVSLGVIPGYGGTQRLAQIVGKGKAMEMVLTGGMIDAEASLACGLVNQVVDPELLLETAHVMAGKIAKNAPTAPGCGPRQRARRIQPGRIRRGDSAVWAMLHHRRFQGRYHSVPRKAQAPIPRFMSEHTTPHAVVVPVVADTPHALPSYSTEDSAGLDLRAKLDAPVTLQSGQAPSDPHGTALGPASGYEAQVRPRAASPTSTA